MSVTLLNVDHNDAARYAKSRLLRLAGYQVMEARTGAEALRLTQELRPPLVLVDVLLPDMDGTEVCRQIKANPETTHLMVLHVTASRVTSTDRTLGLERGADGYLLEPVEPAELVASVRALLRLYDREQENRRLLAQLRNITESGITGVAFFNTSGVITDANQTFLNMVGYDTDDLKAGLLRWDALTPPEWMPRTRQAIEEFHATGRITPYEKQYIRRDGQRLWGLFGGARIGQSEEGIALVLDISARKRSDHALRESEGRLRLALESSALGVWEAYWPDGHCRVDSTTASILGWPANVDVSLEQAFDSVHPEDRASLRDQLTRAIEGDGTYASEHRIVRQGGAVRWVASRGFVQAEQGHPTRMIGVIADITKRKEREDFLRESESRFRMMADTVPVLIWVSGTDKRAVYFNKSWLDFTGRTMEQELGDRWTEGIHPDDRPGYRETYTAAFDARQPFEIEYRLRRADGHYRSILDRGTPQITGRGEFVGYIGSCVDITERSDAEQRLREWTTTLEERVKERTDELVRSQDRLRALAAEVTLTEERERRRIAAELHDYLAQLLVLGRMQLSQGRKLLRGTEQQKWIQDLDHVLTQSLTYTRSLVVQLSPPVLHESGLIRALHWLAETMRQNSLTVDVQTTRTSVALPEDRAVLLYQSIRELLFNVVKHAGIDHADVSVDVADDQLRIVVSDQGDGFDLTAAGNHQPLTSGYGLFSIRERMALMGGTLTLYSAPGQGTRVTICLPYKAQPAPGGVLSSGTDPASAGGHVPTSSAIRILLVDDHAMVRQGLRSILDGYVGIEVVGEAGNGYEALAHTGTLAPDVVIMDVNMPELNGIEATWRIKKDHPQVRVIGLSVNNAEHVRLSLLQAGAEAFLNKDCAVDQLYQTIQHVMAAK